MKLVIAEKPSASKAYADVLGAKSKKDGYYEGNGYIVSWCVGHLLGLAEPSAYDEKYAKWDKNDLPISPSAWKYIASPSTKKQLKMLVDLMKRPDIEVVINGADAGREGELIFRLVYEHAKCNKPVKRLWVSSMEESALKEGFRSLRNGADYDRLYQAAKCRQQADWLVGMNYSRLFSIVYNANLRVGRVQTPTLAMVVERFEKINSFAKEPFYVVELAGVGFTAKRERLMEKHFAVDIADKCNGQTAVIRSVKKQEKSIAPPRRYDLTTLQREANKMFGITASKTLEILQGLYEKKLVTYPRTDSKFITDDMAHSIPSLVEMSAQVMPFSVAVSKVEMDNSLHLPVGVHIAKINTTTIVKNAGVTDHHAILPTMQLNNVNINTLSKDEISIVVMICAKLLCAVNEKHIYAETTVTVECNGEVFTAKGKTVTKDGWKQIEDELSEFLGRNNKADGESAALPTSLCEGQQFVADASVREGFTSPPKHFTEDTLLSAMENAGAEGVEEEIERKGLGTPATRAGIIENLVKNDFLRRDKKNLLPTDKGVSLIKVLPDKVKSPLLTADWENNLKRMERGEVTASEFMQSINDFVGDIIRTYGNAPTDNDNPFGSTNGSGEIIGKCPRCGGDVSETPKAFSCERTRSKACAFILWKENKFFLSQGKKITKGIAAQLVNDGRVFIPDLKSKKTNKKYGATILIDDSDDGYICFKLEFNSAK